MLSSQRRHQRLIFAWIAWITVTVSCAQAIAISDTSPIINRRKVTRLSRTKNLQDIFLQERFFEDDGQEPQWTRSSKDDDDADDERYHGTDILDPSKYLQERFPLRGGAVERKEAAWVDGLKNSMASALAAAFSKTILAPFDTIKTLQQYHQTSSDVATLTLLQAAQQIMQRPGGFANFYVRPKQTKRKCPSQFDSTRHIITSTHSMVLFFFSN